MQKGFNNIKEISQVVDLFIVVLDARAPMASYNENFDAIAPNKPRLFVITKIDLADQSKLSSIVKKFNNENDKVLLVNLKKNNSKSKILKAINKLLEAKRKKDITKGFITPRLKAVVIGVPNSGKSTLINLLATKVKTKVANTPGITKHTTWINAGNIYLMDTPGILTPKFTNKEVAIKLAIIGSIKTSIIPLEDLYYESYNLLSKIYQNKIKNIGLQPCFDKIDMYSELIKLCKNKSMILKNNQPDTNKAMHYFINHIKKLKGVTYD